MTQSIQTLDERTQKDLQYVHRMEVQLRGLETKFKQVEENHKQNIAKQYKVWQDNVFTHLFFQIYWIHFSLTDVCILTAFNPALICFIAK